MTGIHEEAQEDDIFDSFSKFGEIKSLHLNLDRRSGYAKGYALVEYAVYEEAVSAIRDMNGYQLLQKLLAVDWAFQEKPLFDKKKK